MKIIRRREFREGRWRNGMGVSWDIASDPFGTEDFGWRLAIARIERDVPFSIYPDVDRIFTLIEGRASPRFRGRRYSRCGPPLRAASIPLRRAGLLPSAQGPCMALNLFTRRGQWTATADILSSRAEIAHEGPVLLFALASAAHVNGEALGEGDAAMAEDEVEG